MRLLMIAGLIVSGTQLNSMDNSPASYWGQQTAPQPTTAVQKTTGEEAPASYKNLISFLSGHQDIKPDSSDDAENLEAMFSTDAGTTQESEEEKNQSNFSAMRDDDTQRIPSSLGNTPCVQHEPSVMWQGFFSSSSEESEDEYTVKKGHKKSPSLKTCRDYHQSQRPWLAQWATQCEQHTKAKRKIISPFKPHELFALLLSNEHILEPYLKVAKITSLEAYIATAWLKKHRSVFLDDQHKGCAYCAPATVLKGECRCPTISKDQQRVGLLKEKIAIVVGAVKKFVMQAQIYTALVDQFDCCSWVPLFEERQQVPYPVLALAKRARKHLKIHPSLKNIVHTGFEAYVNESSDESDDASLFSS